ncbi:MAG TPA: hypothetical protein V6D09_19525 [Leptolyngbyaceae cyanobacterium]
MSEEQNSTEAVVSLAAISGAGQLGAGLETNATNGAASQIVKDLKNCQGLECVALGVALPGVMFGSTHGFGSPRMHE